jgi:ABC-type multidrug transport system fused ATPase/permease subunit
MSAPQVLDLMFKLNFNVVFPARALMRTMPQITNLRAPLLRICDLLDYSPKIEPSPDLLQIKVSSSDELARILASCSMVKDGMFSDCRLVTTCGLSGGDVQVPAGSQLVSYWSEGMEMPINDNMSIPGTVSYPVWVQFSEKIRPARFHGHIEFDDVHFAYPSAMQKPVLQGLSFTVEPGQKVALVGKTGCGKSSVMSLLQRLYRPQSGRIKIDGRPIEDYDVHFLRSRIVIVDQSTVLFAKTLRENIAYGLHGVTDEEVRHACQNAVAWEFINEKPDKLMTAVTTGGANLSGGQRQRVAIARAMIRKPDVILLDEATSALDAKNERVVQEALDKLAQNGSALVVAHRLSTIQDSDKIIVVNDGTKVQEGVHEDLLKQPVVREVEVGTPGNSAPQLQRQFSQEMERSQLSPCSCGACTALHV